MVQPAHREKRTGWTRTIVETKGYGKIGAMMGGKGYGVTAARARTSTRVAIALALALPAAAPAAANVDGAPIIEAARNQDAEAVRTLIADGADVNARQPDGATALHWAAYRDDLEIADLLIDAGADVTAANELGATPLWLAADNSSARMVERLLDAGADPNVTLPEGETPIMTASRTGSVEAVRLLLAHGADIDAAEASRDQTALMWAVAQGHHDVIAALLEHGADVAARSRIRPRLMHSDSTNASQYDQGIVWNRGGYTPLLFAARHGNTEAGRLLVAGGADINETAPTGASVLTIATHSGQTNFALFALEAGADPNARGAGYTPLHAAILRGDLGLVRALTEAGADPNARLEKGTPLRRAGQDWYIAPQLTSATPFWLAAYYQEPQIMRALVDAGADPSLTTLEMWESVFERAGGVGPPYIAGGFQSPLLAAVRGQHNRGRVFNSSLRDPDADERQALEAASVAIEFGADVNHTDRDGTAPIHTAAQRNYATVVELLAEHGADLALKNGNGQTPLQIAEGAEQRRAARPDITTYPSGNSAQALRDLGVVHETAENVQADGTGQQQ